MKRNFIGKDWILLVALVTLVLVVVAWLVVVNQHVDGNGAQAQHLPTLQMNDFVSLGMDLQGHPKQRLKGKQLVHFAAANYSEIEAPDLSLYDAHQGSWRIQSDHGIFLRASDEVLLSGNVHIWRSDALDRDKIDIYTQNLRLYLQAEYAETRAPARVHTEQSSSVSHGARIYLNTREIELLTSVKHIYHPHTVK